MHGSVPYGRKVAITVDGKVAGSSAADDADWFSRAARALYPNKPGTALYWLTGLGDERLCQRYASGDVRPAAYFLRALMRGEHGEQWFSAIMDGCDAEWWRDVQRARRVAAALDAVE